ADERQLVSHLGQLRHQLGDLEAGGACVDRPEDAAHPVGDVFLGVPEVKVARAALEVEEDDAPGPAEAGTVAPAGLVLGGVGRGPRLPGCGGGWAGPAVDVFPRRSKWASLGPGTAAPPTRNSPRRVTPSQVSFPAGPGITSIGLTSSGVRVGRRGLESGR